MNLKSKIRNLKSYSSNESGMATIIAIGLTSMLLVLAVAFVTTSMIELKSSVNNTSLITARIAAQTALARALTAVSNADTSVSYSDIYPAVPAGDATRTAEEKADLIRELPTTSMTDTYFTDTQAKDLVNSNTGITWSYQTNGSDLKWTSRLAYIVIPDTPTSPEAFWSASSATDTTISNSELYERFNLKRSQSEWNSMTISSFLVSDTPFYNNTSTDTSNTIAWLRNWKDSLTSAPTDTARQIIANLIDYCDSNDTPTSDGTADPAYLGLEAVPYINRVTFQIPGTITVSTAGSGGSLRYTYKFSSTTPITEKIQFVNMYSKSISVIAKLEYTISLRYGRTSGTLTTLPANTYSDTTSCTFPNYTPTTKNYSTQSVTQSSVSGFNYSIPAGSGSISTTTTSPFTDTIIQAQMTKLKVRLYATNGTTMYDYSNILASSSEWFNVVANTTGTATTPPGPTILTIYFETRDPRENGSTSDWVINTSLTSTPPADTANNNIYPTVFYGGTSLNKIWTDTDVESGNTPPWNLSTAYISNAPMVSLKELGFIHRAQAFQTLNLKVYNDTIRNLNQSTAPANSYYYTYSGGDANILDQVKLSADTQRSDKTNLNTRDKSDLRSFFISPSYLNNTYTDTIKTLVDSIRSESPNTLYRTRASILTSSDKVVSNYITTKIDTSQTNDTAMELLIGSSMNSLEALPETFYVIAIGEAFSEALADSNDTYRNYDIGSDTVIASQKILAHIRRNIGTDTSGYKTIELQYLSE